ncbi:Acyl-homoserine lactone acylase QuiP precursor [Pseudobythopirellula maris]|uniref:Acyl-homoserine lactone acylase QuiP n=1 Tax=Pseudobythopirellula maris TaxID=2527991 RepID=A0A5C5ZWV2_9BACT|nr:penicillin acylase family protein [Pseudobythopirellula maris]TWT90783.1 Acyl-homoserine lactone acylase QuiP precursor [Pseudobythopirellula maris]
METISTKYARCDFTAERDDAGVPHVRAGNWLEAVYALGYLHAVDRPTQMAFARAVAMGKASEQIADKPALLEMDSFLRRSGIHLRLDEEIAALEPRIRDQLEWYCRGVNDGFEGVGRTLPMLATGFRPEPWDPASVLAMGNLLSFAGLAVGEQEAERVMMELIQLGIEDERLRELFRPYLDGVDLEPLREIRMMRQMSDDALELLADLPRLAGSNAWAVAPSRSATGGALLASDPHLEVNRLPAIWYEAVLRWPAASCQAESGGKRADEFAMGATLPGCPLMAVGRTRRLSWGVTYMHANTSDFFIEDCRPAPAEANSPSGWQCRRGDQWENLGLRVERIVRKGKAPLELRVLENEQGALTREPDEAGKYLSVCWVGSRPGAGRSIGIWLDVLAAPSVAAAMEAVKPTPHPSLVWLLADSEGHIGKQACGWLPMRDRASGLVPTPAWDEANHWRGVVDPELLPSEYDPPIGFVASANEELYRTDGEPLHSHGLHDYRKRRIVERLTELPRATLADMQELQYDVTSVHARELRPVLLKHLDKDSPLRQRLEAWDCRYDVNSFDAALFQTFYRCVLLEFFGHERGIGWRRMLYLATRIGYSAMVLTAIDRTLPKVTSAWWRDRDKGELVRRAAERALAEADKPWSEVNTFHFTNRFFGGMKSGRLLGFNTPLVAMPGCHATPFQGHLKTTSTRESTFAPSYHFVADMATAEAWTNLPGGPSENRFSKWYLTDIPRWLSGSFKRLE